MDTYNVFPCRLELVANRQRQVAVLGRHAVVDIKQAEVKALVAVVTKQSSPSVWPNRLPPSGLRHISIIYKGNYAL